MINYLFLNQLCDTANVTECQECQNDYDMIDYLNELREGCLEAYTGIVQGLKGDNTTNGNAIQPVNQAELIQVKLSSKFIGTPELNKSQICV